MNPQPWTEVKKDWVYQRKKTLTIFKSWQPRYMVLYSKPTPALALYEQRSDSVAPYAPLLHLELVDVIVDKWKATELGNNESFAPSHAEIPSNTLASKRNSIVSQTTSEFRFLQKSSSRKQTEENALVILKKRPDGSPIKLVVALNSPLERDEWIDAIRSVISDSLAVQESTAVISPPELPTKRPSLTTTNNNNNANGLSCLGVTIIKESKMARLQANQPCLLLSQSNEAADSIFNEIRLSTAEGDKSSNSSNRLVTNVFPGKLYHCQVHHLCL